jgi:Glycine rich protein
MPSILRVDSVQTTTGVPVFSTDTSGNMSLSGSLSINGNFTQATLYSFSVNSAITFSSSLTGRMGMTLSQARSQLVSQTGFASWGNNRKLFDVVGGVMYWVVPQTGTYRFDVKGSKAGVTYGGRGRFVKGTCSLLSGDILRILVGQTGVTGGGNRAGGGGASAVALLSLGGIWRPLVIAGAGNGTSDNEYSAGGQSNRDARWAIDDTPEPGRGSIYQNNYGTDITSYWGGGGGASWVNDGEEGGIGYWPSSYPRPKNAGTALSSAIPKGGFSESGSHGGFGGGGSTGRDSGAGGGGGGYRGGDAMYCTTGATPLDGSGGGTSYIDTDLVDYTSTGLGDQGLHSEAGSVIITRTV